MIVIILIFIILLLITNKKENYIPFLPTYKHNCNCNRLGKTLCGTCTNCGWCINKQGYGKCVAGDKHGPFDKKQKCDVWVSTLNDMKHKPRFFDRIFN